MPTPSGTLLEFLFVSLAAAVFVGEDVGVDAEVEDNVDEAVAVLEELEDVVEVVDCVELVGLALLVEWVIDRASVVMTFAPAAILNTCDEFVQSQPPKP